MMNLTHGRELDEETLSALASGRAEPAVRLLIDTVLALRGLEDLFAEAAAGAMLEAAAEAELAPDALAKALAAIDALGPETPVASPRKTYPEVIQLPPQLQALVREAEAGKGWEYAGPGLRSLQLIKQAGRAKAEIIRIEPGAKTPVHTHYGREATLCLVGGFSDARGSYGPGDVSLTDATITHQPVGDEDGVCFVLAVTDAGLKFKGVFGLLQKLLGQ